MRVARIPLIAVVVAALAAPAAGAARAEVLTRPARGPVASFQLHGSHGYSIFVQLQRKLASVEVQPPGTREEGFSTASYLRFAGSVGEDRVKARLGRFAAFDAEFAPSGRVKRIPHPRCSGGPTVVRFGSFRGKLRFHGEGGYTEAAPARVRGRVVATPAQTCRTRVRSHHEAHHQGKRDHRKSGKSPRFAVFEASDGEVTLGAAGALGAAGGTGAMFFALDSETTEGVQIARTVLLTAPGTSFATDDALDEATIAPPAPFAGSARFERIDDYTTRWQGPLTVSFLGHPDVPLTGREFSWSLRSLRQPASGAGVSFAVGGGFGRGR